MKLAISFLIIVITALFVWLVYKGITFIEKYLWKVIDEKEEERQRRNQEP